VLAVAATLLLGACHTALPRLSAQGRHAEVVARAEQARRRPKGKAARAWAASLVALGRVEEARAVLLRDFRVTAQLPSLVALADLELREGLRGVAAAHYARAASLEVDVLRGREDVCALFRDRAERLLAQGEALAADLDMRRVALFCPVARDADARARQQADHALHRRIAAAAAAQARAQRTLAGCRPDAAGARPCVAAPAEREVQRLDAALRDARTRGPAELRAAARRLGAQLSARDVPDLLAAELRGDLGLDIVTHDELRAWIGDTAPAAIQAAIAALPPVEDTYVRLRLAQLGPGYELPGDDAARSTASVVVRLLELFDADPGAAAMSWRVFVLVGDLPSAELALTAGLGVGATPSARPADAPVPKASSPADAPVPKASSPADAPVPKASSPVRPARGGPAPKAGPAGGAGDVPPAPASPAWTPAQTRVPVPKLWSARRQVDAGSLPKLLLLARLRGLAGHDDQALEIAVYALAEAHAAGLPGAEALAVAEARRYLAAGQPWGALAVASAVPGAAAADLAQAAGAALVLARAACDGPCGDDPRDRVAVRQVLGEPWLTAQEARARDLALARPFAPPPLDGCPTLGELLAPDARGALADALQQARRARGPATAAPPEALGTALRRAVESDPTLSCAGRLVAPLLHAGDHRVAATILADELVHAPQEVAARALAVQSELALGLGRREQADLFAVAAAAASADPRAVWARAARMAALVDARHHEVLALRQGLMHTAAADAAPLRLRLTVRALRDANDAWAVRSSEVGREALLRGVQSYLDSEPPARRWQARDDLAHALAGYRWADVQAALLIRAAVWSEPGLERLHPAAAARLEQALGGAPDPLSRASLAPSELAAALAVEAGVPPELPASAAAFVPVDQLQQVRLELARRHPDPRQRRQAAIAVAATGDADARVAALRLLLADLAAEPARRDAVVDLLLAGLGAAAPAGPEPLVAAPEDLLALVFDLQRDPERARPEIKGDPLR
jgi:hypothetical protein